MRQSLFCPRNLLLISFRMAASVSIHTLSRKLALHSLTSQSIILSPSRCLVRHDTRRPACPAVLLLAPPPAPTSPLPVKPFNDLLCLHSRQRRELEYMPDRI